MKRKYSLLPILLIFFILVKLSAQDIIFITTDNRDDEQVNFLLRQGFNVTKFDGGVLDVLCKESHIAVHDFEVFCDAVIVEDNCVPVMLGIDNGEIESSTFKGG